MIQHHAVFVQDHGGKLWRVAGDNADFMIQTHAPVASADLARDAIRKVAAQDVIEVQRGDGSRHTWRWEGEYADLVTREV